MSLVVKRNRFCDVFRSVWTASIIVDHDGLVGSIWQQLARHEFIAVNNTGCAEINITVINAHSSTVPPRILVLSEVFDDVGLSISCCVAQRNGATSFGD